MKKSVEGLQAQKDKIEVEILTIKERIKGPFLIAVKGRPPNDRDRAKAVAEYEKMIRELEKLKTEIDRKIE